VNLRVVDSSDIELVKLLLESTFVILSEEKRVFLVSKDFSTTGEVKFCVTKLKLKFIDTKSLKSVGNENIDVTEANLRLKIEVIKEFRKVPVFDSMFNNQELFHVVCVEDTVIDVILFNKCTTNEDNCSVIFEVGLIK